MKFARKAAGKPWPGMLELGYFHAAKQAETEMIPPKTVQEIQDATRIEDVVGEFVTLRRRGSNLMGLCPFHNEKSPSFNVNPVRNIFKCFGCGKAGDAITFLREHENFTFVDSLRWLAKKYNIEIEEVTPSAEEMAAQQMGDSLFIVNEFAQKAFSDFLFETDLGRNVGLSYFTQRGFTEETVRKWELGFAPESRDFIIKKAAEKGHSLDFLKKLGLTNRDGTADFFRNRVMFPIHATSGKVAAFAGRIIGKVEGAPKYINSPETEIYNKSRTLYGFHLAKKAVRQLDECILTEGYTDVISLHQAGIENVVASSGTSLTVEQILLIKRNTQNILILYDGDAAGIKAALRGMDLILEQDMNVRLVLLPGGEDPDSFVQRVGAVDFRAFIKESSVDFILFKSRTLLDEAKGDPIERAGLVKEIMVTVARIPDPIKRSVYIKECSGLLGIDEETLVAEVKKLITTGIRKAEEKASRQPGAASDSGSFGESMPPPSEPPADFWGDRPATPPPSHRETAPSGREPVAAPVRDQTAQQTGEPRSPEAGQPISQQRGGSTMGSDEFQERDIVRILIQFGGHLLEKEGVTVGEFIIGDIAESIGSFDNPVYGKVAQECHEQIFAGNKLHQNHFLTHSNREFSQLAINLLAQPFDYSPGWEEMHNFPLQNQPMPEMNFSDDMTRALLIFKRKKVDKMCVLNQQRIKQAEQSGDSDSLMRYLKIQQKLLETRNLLAKKTGTVVFK